MTQSPPTSTSAENNQRSLHPRQICEKKTHQDTHQLARNAIKENVTLDAQTKAYNRINTLETYINDTIEHESKKMFNLTMKVLKQDKRAQQALAQFSTTLATYVKKKHVIPPLDCIIAQVLKDLDISGLPSAQKIQSTLQGCFCDFDRQFETLQKDFNQVVGTK
jgi:hypothetical protein